MDMEAGKYTTKRLPKGGFDVLTTAAEECKRGAVGLWKCANWSFPTLPFLLHVPFSNWRKSVFETRPSQGVFLKAHVLLYRSNVYLYLRTVMILKII